MLSRSILPAIARIISFVFPTRAWYRLALAVSFLLSRVLWLQASTGRRHTARYEQAILLNRMLAFLARRGKAYGVPWRWLGDSESLLDRAIGTGRGVIYCSAHLPLIKVAVRALIETGRGPAAAIAAEPGPDGRIPIWGLANRLDTLKTGPEVLLKARTLLRRPGGGGSVLLLVDTLAGDYSPNIFRLAKATRAEVILFTAELESDGVTGVRFFHPPSPGCGDDAEIEANLRALDGEIRRISGREIDPAFDRVPVSRLT